MTATEILTELQRDNPEISYDRLMRAVRSCLSEKDYSKEGVKNRRYEFKDGVIGKLKRYLKAPQEEKNIMSNYNR